MPQVNSVPVLKKFHQNQFLGSNTSPHSGKKKKLVSVRAAQQKHDYPTLENQPLMSIEDSSVKLTRNRDPNNMLIHLEMDGH